MTIYDSSGNKIQEPIKVGIGCKGAVFLE